MLAVDRRTRSKNAAQLAAQLTAQLAEKHELRSLIDFLSALLPGRSLSLSVQEVLLGRLFIAEERRMIILHLLERNLDFLSVLAYFNGANLAFLNFAFYPRKLPSEAAFFFYVWWTRASRIAGFFADGDVVALPCVSS